jgi:molecular chaperone DnaK (HSP70)
VSFLGDRGGVAYPHCYKTIVRRNTPLPVTRSERFYTSHPYQEEVDVRVYEGEDEDALRNILVGDFTVKGLTPMRDFNEVICRMSLDLDGILNVTAIEKKSGLSKRITIARALEAKSEAEVAASRERLGELYATRHDDNLNDDIDEEMDLGGFEDGHAQQIEREGDFSADAAPKEAAVAEDDWSTLENVGRKMIERSRLLFDKIHEEDREEAIDLNQAIESAIENQDAAAIKQAVHDLREMLFFVEGHV